MVLNKQQIYSLLTLLSLVYALAWYIQSSLPINCDISWLVIATERLLKGGTYSKDFFEPSPPMILLIYAPVVILQKWLQVDMAYAMRTYIFIIASISLYGCYLLLKKIFNQSDVIQGLLFITCIAIVFLILPVSELGQRDHLLLLLTLPYFLAMTVRLQGEKLNNILAFCIGLTCGIGIAIKPQFILIPISAELYFLYCKRNILACLRIETIILFAVVLSFWLFVFLFFPDYFSIICRYCIQFYFKIATASWIALIYSPFVFCWAAICFYILRYKKNSYKQFSTVLLIMLLNFLIIYASLQMSMYSHILPALGVASLLLILVFSQLILSTQVDFRDYVHFVSMGIILLGFLVFLRPTLWTVIILQPVEFFSFIAILFTLLLFLIKKRLWKAILAGAISILLSYAFAQMSNMASPYAHTFSLTLILLFLLFTFLTHSTSKNQFNRSLIGILALIVFSLPMFFASEWYHTCLGREKYHSKLNQFLKTPVSNHSVYFLSTSMIGFPGIASTKAQYISEFPQLWMIPGIVKQYIQASNYESKVAANSDKNFIINLVAEEINLHKPDYIILNMENTISFLDKKNNFHRMSFDILNYFLKDPNFQKVWSDYYFLMKEMGPASLKFAVYKRKEIPIKIGDGNID